jgi:acylphosphatase
MKTAHLVIAGKVQGVFFRARAKDTAEKHKISGWIKNTDDGKVEAYISGEENALDKFISWCKQGPEKARVEHVVVNYVPPRDFDRFEVIR